MSFRVALRRVALALLAATFANGKKFKYVPEQAVELADSARSMRIFCFVWTTRRSGDQALEPEVRRQLNKCDGHLFFTDTGSTGPDSSDIVKLNIPAQDVGRSDEKWLYHRNMVGVLPSWTHIFNKGLNDQYDWFIHLEMDHFLSPNRARANIAQWLSIRGKEPNATNDIPIVLMWGNAFVFNKKFVNAMKFSWHTLGAVAGPGEGQGKGCPLFLKGKFEWPASCSQDIYYPQLFSDHGRSLLPDDADFAGASGCGQEAKNQVNEEYPLGCFEMAKNPIGGVSYDLEMAAIQLLAKMKDVGSLDAAEAKCRETQVGSLQDRNNCKMFYDGRNVPIIHHVGQPQEHVLARSLLDNDADPGFQPSMMLKFWTWEYNMHLASYEVGFWDRLYSLGRFFHVLEPVKLAPISLQEQENRTANQ